MTAPAHARAEPGQLSCIEEDARPQLRAAVNRLFMRRMRLGMATIMGGIVLFTVVDLVGQIPRGTPLYALRAASIGLLAYVYVLLRQPRFLPYAPLFSWLLFAMSCALTTLDSTPIVYVLFAFTAGAFFPWGVRVQMAAAAVAAAALGFNLYWVHGSQHPIITYQGAEGLAVCLIASVVCASGVRARLFALIQDTIERRRAEEHLRQSNDHLERRVRARLAEIEAARKELARQVDENEKVAETLRENENLLRAIIDNSSALIHVKSLDGRYILSNTRHSQLFGQRHEALLGKTPYDLYPAEVASRILANDRQVLAATRPLQFEEVVSQPDGEHTYLSVKFAVRDPSGAAYGICGISTDITERKRMERALRQSQSTLSTLIENSDEGIWALDRDYRFQLLNSAARQRFPRAYGTQPQIGADIRELLPADIRPHWVARFRQAYGGQRMVTETSLTRRGETQHFLVGLNPIVEATEVMGVTMFIKDITALKRAEEQALQHQAELAHVLRRSTMGELAAELAHEINQPLGAIANYAQGCSLRLQSGNVALADLGEAIDQIACQAQRAGEILGRLQRTFHHAPVRNEAIDVNQVARNAIRAVEFRCSGFVVQLDLAPALPPGHGDSIQIEQVVLNLLHNGIDALQALPAAARRLTVETRLANGPAIEVAVSDSGTGLDPAVADKLCQPFVTTKPDGLGMGLAISRSIVEAHHGRLWVTSPRGAGCTFHFTLPVASAA